MKLLYFIIAWALWTLALLPFIGETRSEKSGLKETILNIFFDKSSPLGEKPNLSEVREGIEKFELLQEQYKNPYDLGQVIIENLESVVTLEEQHPNTTSHINPLKELDSEELYLKSDHELKVGQNYQLSLGMRPKSWMPIKGKWKALYFLKKFSSDPDAVLPDSINIEPITENLIDSSTSSSSSTSGSKNIYTSYSFYRHLQINEPGVWLLQARYFPDNLMSKTADGVHAAEAEVLRVRFKQDDEKLDE